MRQRLSSVQATVVNGRSTPRLAPCRSWRPIGVSQYAGPMNWRKHSARFTRAVRSRLLPLVECAAVFVACGTLVQCMSQLNSTRHALYALGYLVPSANYGT